MKDLIERQAAIDAVLGACKDAATTECAVRELEELPSAQPNIITCSECKYFKSKYHWCEYHEREMSLADYCSRAERRADE